MFRRLALATKKPRGLLSTLNQTVEELLCSALRGEPVPWTEHSETEFSDAVLQWSEYHGVQALLSAHLEAASDGYGWPGSIRGQLRQSSRAAVAFDLLRAHLIGEVGAAFARQGIEALIIKGEALARLVFPKPHLRTRVDTDLLISMRHIEPVREAMTGLGFQVVSPIYKTHQFSCIKEGRDALVQLDIHWRVLNAPQFARVISFEHAVDRAIPVPGLAGWRTLGPEHSMLLACMHLKGSTFHDENRLIWLYDIHLMADAMTSEQMNSLVDEAVLHDVLEECIDGLKAAQLRFRSRQAQVLIDRLAAYRPVIRKTHRNRFATSNLALLIDDMKCLPNARARAALLRELFLPTPAELMEKYNKSNRNWLPWLYAQQLLGGIAKRLSLQ